MYQSQHITIPQAWQLYGLWEALGGSGPNQPMRMPGMRPKLQRLQLQIAPDVVMVKDRLSAPRTELIAFKYAFLGQCAVFVYVQYVVYRLLLASTVMTAMDELPV